MTGAEFEQAARANALFDAHREDPEFGYRFLADEARSVGSGMADRDLQGQPLVERLREEARPDQEGRPSGA